MQQEDKEKYGNVLVSLTRYMIVVVCLFVITAICALILVLNPGRTDAEAPEPVKNEIEVKAKEN